MCLHQKVSQLFHSVLEAELCEWNLIQESYELNQFNQPQFRGLPSGGMYPMGLWAYLASKPPLEVEIKTLQESLNKNNPILKSEELDKYDLAGIYPILVSISESILG